MCAVGFRPSTSPDVPSGSALEEDGQTPFVYIHDDNLGPSVRFSVMESDLGFGGEPRVVVLQAAPPPPLHRSPNLLDPAADYFRLIPSSLVAALPGEIRMTTDFLNARALELASVTAKHLHALSKRTGVDLSGVTYSSGFFKLSAYLGVELPRRLVGRRLAKTRMALANHVRPMSLHLGVARVGIGGLPLFDVLYDTTDSEPATAAFAHVLFQQFYSAGLGYPGVAVIGY